MVPADNPDAEPGDVATQEGTGEAVEERMDLDVNIEEKGPCERHVTVTVPRKDIDRYYDKAFEEIMDNTQVPGFRLGKAPRKLVEKRFRKDVSDQVKSSILVDSMTQLSDDKLLAPISEPDIDVDAVDIPEEGAMTFEFDIEVRPEFDMPQWKGLKVEKPVHEFTEEDIDKRLQQVLADRGTLVPHDGPASPGDYVVANLVSTSGKEQLNELKEATLQLLPTLRFVDGDLTGFDKLLSKAKAGTKKKADVPLSDEAPNEDVAGKKVKVEFEVLEVKKLELPELNDELLGELGDFENEQALRDAIRQNMERQVEYQERRQAREQILDALTKTADWELPEDLLERQASRELERSIMELRRSGFSDHEIRAHETQLRQQSRSSTARSLKEHFVLERIAEEEQIEDEPQDYELEITLIAMQTGQNPRRVRSQLEKAGQMDVLRNQIIERKVIDKIMQEADFKEVPYEPEALTIEAVDWAAGGIPETSEEEPAEA